MSNSMEESDARLALNDLDLETRERVFIELMMEIDGMTVKEITHWLVDMGHWSAEEIAEIAAADAEEEPCDS